MKYEKPTIKSTIDLEGSLGGGRRRRRRGGGGGRDPRGSGSR